jgi:hypothetical protein
MSLPVSPGEVRCPVCRIGLPSFAEESGAVVCHGCQTPFDVWRFPGVMQSLTPGSLPERLGEEGEAACFYHAGSRAVVPCSRCGRFLCALCDLTWHGEHVCPTCLPTITRPDQHAELASFRFLPGQLGFALTTLVPLLYPLTFFTWMTSPAAVVLGVMGLRRPGRVTGRGRWMSWAAIVLGVLQTLAWIALAIWLLDTMKTHWRSDAD